MDMDRIIRHYQQRLSAANAEVRLMALKALVALEQPPSLDRTVELLQTDPDMRVRMAAVEVLGLFYPEESLGALAVAARFDTSDRVRLAAAAYLVASRKPEAAPVLLDLLRHDQSRQVRHVAYGYLVADPDAPREPLLEHIARGDAEALYALMVAAKIHGRMDLVEAATRVNPTLVVREIITSESEKNSPFGPLIAIRVEAELMRQNRHDLVKSLRDAFRRDHELER